MSILANQVSQKCHIQFEKKEENSSYIRIAWKCKDDITTKVFAKLESEDICATISKKPLLDLINKAAYMLVDEEEILSKSCKNLSHRRMRCRKKSCEKRVMWI